MIFRLVKYYWQRSWLDVELEVVSAATHDAYEQCEIPLFALTLITFARCVFNTQSVDENNKFVVTKIC